MIGNDIVDLKTAAQESNWQRKGFLEKLFTPDEQLHIWRNNNPEQTLWRFWTMKESAYKIYTRVNGRRFFAPHLFSCKLLNASEGQIRFKNNTYSSITTATTEYLYSIATQGQIPGENLAGENFELPDAGLSENMIHKKIIQHFSTMNRKPEHEYGLIKNYFNIPSLYSKTDGCCLPVSITHHGRYAAFTYKK